MTAASMEFWQSILLFTALNAILAYGFYITLSSGMLSLAHASLAGIAAYAAAILTTNFGWSIWAALAVGVVVSASVGFLLGTVTVRMNLLVSSLVTLGFGQTASIVALAIPYLGGANSFIGIPLYTTLPMVLAALAVVVYVCWRFDGSRLGLAARAVRDNPVVASASGVNVLWVRGLTFALGGAIAGVAGVFSAHYTLVINPADLGFWASFYLQVYVILGGSYYIGGPLLGSVLLTPLAQVLRFAGPYRFAIYGLVIVAVLLLRPTGLLTRRSGSQAPRARWWLPPLAGPGRAAEATAVAAASAERPMDGEQAVGSDR